MDVTQKMTEMIPKCGQGPLKCEVKLRTQEFCSLLTMTSTRVFNLMDISDDVLVHAAGYLPDEDKIKLIDIVPKIENYVKSFKTNTRSTRKGIPMVDLLKRLPNLRKVITTTPGWSKEHKVLVNLTEINPRLVKFDGFEVQDVLDYIERVKQLDPSYDAHEVRKVFNYRLTDAVIKKYPDIKLRLFVEMENEKDENRFVKNGRQHLIDHLELQSGYALRFELKSVRELIVSPTISL